VFDVEYAEQYPEEVLEGETVGSMLIEGNAVGESTELPE
jgi:hypothetical protein